MIGHVAKRPRSGLHQLFEGGGETGQARHLDNRGGGQAARKGAIERLASAKSERISRTCATAPASSRTSSAAPATAGVVHPAKAKRSGVPLASKVRPKVRPAAPS